MSDITLTVSTEDAKQIRGAARSFIMSLEHDITHGVPQLRALLDEARPGRERIIAAVNRALDQL